jgi:hypothetical protein
MLMVLSQGHTVLTRRYSKVLSESLSNESGSSEGAAPKRKKRGRMPERYVLCARTYEIPL